jgi:CBS domain-containing protein/ribosome-associated translation inhibitor RaiA
MQIESIFEEPLIISIDTPVSKAVSRMVEKGRSEAVVKDGENVFGVVCASDLIKSNISNPEVVTVQDFARHLSPLHFESDPREILNTILINDYKSLPVERGNEIHSISKVGMMKFFKKDIDMKGKKVDDVMNFPFSIDTDDTIATANALMRDMRVSELVVVDGKDRVDGIVDTLTMLKTIIGRERSKRGEEDGEKIRLLDIPVKSLSVKDFASVPSGTPLGEAFDKMVTGNRHFVIVEEDGRLAGIITPKDILKLLGEAVEGIHVTMSGMHDVDDFTMDIIDAEMGRELKKLNKMVPLRQYIVHMKKLHDTTGDSAKFSLHARLITAEGSFYAENFDFDLPKAMKGLLKKLERELIKKQGKTRDHRKIVPEEEEES